MNNVRETLRGTGNVFADFADADAEAKKLKATVAAEIITTLNARKLTMRAAARLAKMDAADIQRIRNADLSRFTIDRLVRMACRLGCTVEMKVLPAQRRMRKIISTAHPQTFDASLQAFIDENIAVIRAYHDHDAKLEADRRSGGMKYIIEPNPAAEAYLRLREELMDLMRSRTVRCWHYTRLTEDEIEAIRDYGVSPGSVESMTDRVRRQVEAGRLSEAEYYAILAASPLRYPEQARGRLGTFWVTDRALHSTHDGVEPLLGHWGGEVVYFYLQDEDLIAKVRSLGRPVVLELAVPVASTEHAFGFAESVLSTVTKVLGYPPQLQGIDAYLTQPLGSEGIIAIYAPADFDRVIADSAGMTVSD